jgi:hypothetical protein
LPILLFRWSVTQHGPTADGETLVRGDLSNLPAEPGDIVLRLLHTADWHLGRFPSFPEDAQKKLSRARMDVIANILDVARCNSVHALREGIVKGSPFVRRVQN